MNPNAIPIRVGNDDSHIELEVLSVEYPPSPAQGHTQIRIAFARPWVRGFVKAWFSAEDLSTFVDCLRVLESSRSGAAELRSLSPEDLFLSITALSPAQPLVLLLRHTRPKGYECGQESLELAMTVPQEFLIQFLTDCEDQFGATGTSPNSM